MWDAIKDWLGLNRYRMYRKDANGEVYEVGSKTMSWRDVRVLKEIFPNSIYMRDRKTKDK